MDDADVDLDQTELQLDLPLLFNFCPRIGHGAGSGYDDSCSLKTMATGTSQLTTVLGSFTDPVLLAEDEDEDAAGPADAPPVDTILPSTASISELTPEVAPTVPIAADQPSVSSAPAALLTGPSNDEANLVASATSVRQTGVSEMNE